MAEKLVTLKRALISVSNKTGLEELVRALHEREIEILSTGGTASVIKGFGIPVTDVADVTAFPEMMDGRVKTLHPKIHGGILGDRQKHAGDFKTHNITPIDLIVINLYPFEERPSIETIDIGGPAMIRAGAKNHAYVTVVCNHADYPALIAEMDAHANATTQAFRERMAYRAFKKTAAYDAAIQAWLAPVDAQFPERLVIAGQRAFDLRYGENPHQKAAAYRTDNRTTGVLAAEMIQGKELSFNNLQDTDAAWELVNEFAEPAVAIIKHASPCGVALGKTLKDAWEKALASDPVSAFGGIVALNHKITADVAGAMDTIFLEVIIAPEIDDAARKIFAEKQNRRVLITGKRPATDEKRPVFKSIAGGLLIQERDAAHSTKKDLKTVTRKSPSSEQIDDLLFAEAVCKHVKSNAIVLVKDRATIGIGGGQTSRLDSAKIAVAQAGKKAAHSVAASDAFFPFSDGLKILAEAGVDAVLQPGGSKRDDEVIDAADTADIAMVFTNTRHFKH